MFNVSQLTLSFGERFLFKNVSLKFNPGYCYGIIGANGAGKSTFLRILAGIQEYDSGNMSFPKDKRLSFLEQDQFKYDAYSVLETVLMGYPRLYEVYKKREELYSKENLTEEEGVLIGELEGEFGELDGYDLEKQILFLLKGLDVETDLSNSMAGLESGDKVRVLLAKALFGNPDILLLDEPTNYLNLKTTRWLEEFLISFNNVVIVVSHNRHFLNRVCTHIVDIDFQEMRLYPGNYDFWYEMSQLVLKQQKDSRKKDQEKAEELKSFIARFSANASKAKQATSRKRLLEKLDLSDLPASLRKFPFIRFQAERSLGTNVVSVQDLSGDTDNGSFQKLNFTIASEDKIVFLGENSLITALFEILVRRQEPKGGTFSWGQTVHLSYFPKDAEVVFQDKKLMILEWLRGMSKNQDESYLRSLLGRMLFSGEDALKKLSVLSGGERVRVLLSGIMGQSPNVLILDDPTNHLDLEAITALNEGLMDFKGAILFTSSDQQFVSTVANRIIEITPYGLIDRKMNFDDYIEDARILTLRKDLYPGALSKKLIL